MFKVTYLEDGFIKEKEITFEEAVGDIESYFVIMDGVIKDVNVRIEFPNHLGVAATFNNHIKIDSLYSCFMESDNDITLEFEELNQCITINKNANVNIDFIHDRIFINDYNIVIYFNPICNL